MTRVVKEYEIRKNEILDVAQELFYSKGYEQTSIKDIIEAVGIAKGTFYYYFKSKVELLDVMLSRMVKQVLEPVMDLLDGQLNAIEKFNNIYLQIGIWKIDNFQFLKDITKVVYLDENLLLRHKLKLLIRKKITPIVADIIRQGVDEGVFTTDYPDEVAEIIQFIGGEVAEAFAENIINSDDVLETRKVVVRKFEIYNRSIEQLLNAPEGCLMMFNSERSKKWFDLF